MTWYKIHYILLLGDQKALIKKPEREREKTTQETSINKKNPKAMTWYKIHH